jgi:hypothetical protein
MEAEDWRKEQNYHIEKRQYHNRWMHTPGVADLHSGSLKVHATETGEGLIVDPGYAIDNEGHDLFVSEPRQITMPPLDPLRGKTIYVRIHFKEEKADQRDNPSNPDYSGYAFIDEVPVVDISEKEPDNKKYIELARIKLSQSPGFFTDAPSNRVAGSDQVDRSHVQLAGARTSATNKTFTIYDFADLVMDTSVQVRASGRKYGGTGVLLETLPLNAMQPMYMVNVQAMGDAPIHWWIENTQHVEEEKQDFSLNIRNDASDPVVVMCRVFRVRIK